MTEYQMLLKEWERTKTEVWRQKETSTGWLQIMTRTSYEYNFHTFHNSPVYQVFNPAGKRVYVTEDYRSAIAYFDNHAVEEESA